MTTTPMRPPAPDFSLTPVGLRVAGAPDYDAWADYGLSLMRLGIATTWALGDWLEYGEHAYGEKYTQAEALTLKAPDTLAHLAYVARRYPLEARRAGVPWAVHAELAALPAEDRAALLERAADEGWSTQRARAERQARRPRASLPAADAPLALPLPCAVAELRTLLAGCDGARRVALDGCACAPRPRLAVLPPMPE